MISFLNKFNQMFNLEFTVYSMQSMRYRLSIAHRMSSFVFRFLKNSNHQSKPFIDLGKIGGFFKITILR